MKIRKYFLLPLVTLLAVTLSACLQNSDVESSNNESTEIALTQPVPSSPPSGITQAIPSPSGALSLDITTTIAPEQYIYNTDTVTSPDGTYTAIAYTKQEAYTIDAIIDKITIQGGENISEIASIAGYYSNMSWSGDSTRLVINYYGRIWSNFIIYDAPSSTILSEEIYYEAMRSFFEKAGCSFSYELHPNRPDPYICFVEWSEDGKSIKISYSVKDPDWLTQSGTFWYELESGNMNNLEQNPPYEQG